GIGPLLWDGQERSFTWKLRVEQSENSPLTYIINVQQIGQTGNYGITSERLADRKVDYITRAGHQASFLDSEIRQHPFPLDRDSEGQAILSLINVPFGNKVIKDFQKRVEGWNIYQDLRVDQESLIRQPNVTSFEKRLSPNGQNLVSVLHTLYSENRE